MVARATPIPLAAQAQGFLEQLLIKHKICTLHVYKVRSV